MSLIVQKTKNFENCAWFSQKAKEHFGKYSVYLDENNNEVKTTLVGSKGIKTFYGWDDAKYVGKVTKLVRKIG